LTGNVRQNAEWERAALAELRDGSVDAAIEAYRQHQRLILGTDRHDTMVRAVEDWHRHVAATGDPTSGLLIGHGNDTVADLNARARRRLAATGHLTGPTLQTADRAFQAGDRILCHQNQTQLDVLNGDLATVLAVHPNQPALTVQLDRDPQIRELPAWYLNDGNVDYGYALTGHKAQGVTTGHTFTIITGATNREWAYVAMSRGRQTNTLYLAAPQPGDDQCTHLTHPDRKGVLNALTRSLGRSSAQDAAIDHLAAAGPPSSNIAERVDWIVAQHQAETNTLDHPRPGIGHATQR
jgi:ATP-dependent exoDNAse (exonuclease V) alpha subunit